MAKTGLAGAAGTTTKRTRKSSGEAPIVAALEGGGALELRIAGATVGKLTEGDFAKIQSVRAAMGTREGPDPATLEPLLPPAVEELPDWIKSKVDDQEDGA